MERTVGIICIEGIKVYAYHGVLRQENKIGSYYSVDVAIEVCLLKPSASDDICDTVNYASVSDIVQSIMKVPAKLIEHVAHKVNVAIMEAFPKVKRVKTKLSKIAPPVDGEVRQVSVILEHENLEK